MSGNHVFLADIRTRPPTRQLVNTFDHVVHEGQHDVGPAEGNGGVKREEAADSRAECARAEPLQASQINRAPLIDAVEHVRQPPIGPQQAVARHQLQRIGDVVQLEIVAGDRVADIAHREKTAFHDRIQ